MNDEPEITVETLNARIRPAFQHLYLDATDADIEISHNDDETITVHMSEPWGTAFRAVIHSDDDGYLRFTPYDADDDPVDDDHDFISIRVKAY